MKFTIAELRSRKKPHHLETYGDASLNGVLKFYTEIPSHNLNICNLNTYV